MGKFVIKETKNGGFVFNLKAGNGEVIAVSETYSSLSACKNGIESVRKNAVEAKLEDQTAGEELKNPKYELYQD
ncbi:MAG: YegP family protein, partial [Firmicutes bacterium]|nr:YegP family protein [Bacillota bacterium]